MKWKTWCLAGYIATCVAFAAHEGVLYWNGLEGNRGAEAFATTVAILFLVLWLDADSKEHPEIHRPYEYGYLLLFLWLPYLPYYMWRTRRVRGLFAFIGLAGLFFLGYPVQFGLYALR